MDSFKNSFEEKKFSTEFKKFFLMVFTKELIRHSISDDLLKLNTLLKKEEKEDKLVKKKLKEIEKEKEAFEEDKKKYLEKKGGYSGEDWHHLSIMHELPPLPEKKPKSKNVKFKQLPLVKQIPEIKTELTNQTLQEIEKLGTYQIPNPLKIPELIFPHRLQYLRPMPREEEIDLGRLNILLKDPAVKLIECIGANQPIIVNGTMGRKKTPIVLTNDEINYIVHKFSESTRIPITEGIYRVVYGKLIFSAIISQVVASKFLIRKIDVFSYYSSPYTNQMHPITFIRPPRHGRF